MINYRFLQVGLAGLLVFGTAFAAPFANVSSVAQVGSPVTVSGGGFEPGSLINLRLIGPGKSMVLAAVVVAADGTISHTWVAPSDGNYRVQLVYANGRTATNELKFSASR